MQPTNQKAAAIIEMARGGPDQLEARRLHVATAMAANGGRSPRGLLPALAKEWGWSITAIRLLATQARLLPIAADAIAARKVRGGKPLVYDPPPMKRRARRRDEVPAILVTVGELEARRESVLAECAECLGEAKTDRDWTAARGFLALRAKLEGLDRPIPVHVPGEGEEPPEDIEAALLEFLREIRIERQRASLASVHSAVGRLLQTEKDILAQYLAARATRLAREQELVDQPQLMRELVNVLRDLPESVLGTVLAQVGGDEH